MPHHMPRVRRDFVGEYDFPGKDGGGRMSVLIRGMDMPKTCEGCHLQHSEYLECKITGENTWDWENAEAKYKSVNCPLVELPPHGRLIDADELVADIKGQAERLWTLDSVSERDYFIERNEKFRHAMFRAWCESLFAYLDTRPTIIEREVAE